MFPVSLIYDTKYQLMYRYQLNYQQVHVLATKIVMNQQNELSQISQADQSLHFVLKLGAYGMNPSSAQRRLIRPAHLIGYVMQSFIYVRRRTI